MTKRKGRSCIPSHITSCTREVDSEEVNRLAFLEVEWTQRTASLSTGIGRGSYLTVAEKREWGEDHHLA